MNDIEAWLPCRLVPFDGNSPGRLAGPVGGCTAAGWSPDGRWMYFSVEVDGHRHLWRQRFPTGQPEQLTFGPNDEDGVAVFPDGSLVTSVGVSESAIWIRDRHGERAITSVGAASPTVSQGMSSRPLFSSDGLYLYYLLRRTSLGPSTELWRYQVESARHEAVLTGFAITDYDVDPAGAEVVFSAQPAGKPSELWLARLDRSTSPRRLASSGETSPHFGPNGEILFQLSDGQANYLARMNRDGSARSRIAPQSISTLLAVSADRKFVIVFAPHPGTSGGSMASFAVPIDGSPLKQICPDFCMPRWAPDGKHLYLPMNPPSRTESGKTVAIALDSGQMFPTTMPVEGLSEAYVDTLPGVRVIDGGSTSADYRIAGLSPSLDPMMFAYVKASVHHNLFQIRLH